MNMPKAKDKPKEEAKKGECAYCNGTGVYDEGKCPRCEGVKKE